MKNPPSVFVLQEHQPNKEINQWGVYIKSGNRVSLSCNCDVTVTKMVVDCKAIRNICKMKK